MNRRIQALGRLKAGKKNKTEAAYGGLLELRMKAGEVVWYEFEPINLRLGGSVFYAPDYLVQLADGTLEVHEVKGHWTDDARVKIRLAAAKYPFRFIAIKRVKGKWETEEF